MKIKFAALAFAALLLAAAPAFASGVIVDFTLAPSGTANGNTIFTYSTGAGNVYAYGYKCTSYSSSSLSGCTATPLLTKSSGNPGELGLGLLYEDSNEIGPSTYGGVAYDFVMGLDLSNLVGTYSSVTLQFGSLQSTENYQIYGFSSNPFAGPVSLGAILGSHTGPPTIQSSTITLNSSDAFLVITSTTGDSLVQTLSQTPEPGTLALFGTGLLMLGFGLRRRLLANGVK